jgi:uncharacterized protein YcsI (UPF0317 family)
LSGNFFDYKQTPCHAQRGPSDAIRAVHITSRFPKFHGAPIHISKPEMIGVDLARPYDGGGLTQLHDNELPVFWACGATAQAALEHDLSLAAFITNIVESDFSVHTAVAR